MFERGRAAVLIASNSVRPRPAAISGSRLPGGSRYAVMGKPPITVAA